MGVNVQKIINTRKERIINFQTAALFSLISLITGFVGGICANYLYDYYKERDSFFLSLVLPSFIALIFLFILLVSILRKSETDLNKIDKK